MSKVITIDASAKDCKLEIKNIFGTEEYTDVLELDAPCDDKVFNTGKAALGDPHVDAKYDKDTVGKAIVEDLDAWKSKHVAAIRLWKSNQYVYLHPGDTFKITSRCSDETAYYMMMNSDILKVTGGTITPGAEREEASVDRPYLDRETGIGDEDHIKFDSVAFTGEHMVEGAESGATEPTTPAEPPAEEPSTDPLPPEQEDM